jgi:ribosomal protein S18 acetylase RimI-like enzyme
MASDLITAVLHSAAQLSYLSMTVVDRPLTIRRALVADALNVHATLLAAKDDIPLRCPFDSDKYRQWVRNQCRKKAVWVAEIGGRLAGVVVVDGAKIFYLVTVMAYRRCGVGRALVRYAVDIIKRHHAGVTVRVWEKNLPSIKLLTREGFRPHPEQPPRPHPLLADGVPSWIDYFVGDVP